MRLWHLFVVILALSLILAIVRDQVGRIALIVFSESNGKPNWGVRNYGINVYGPMVGLDIQLRPHRHAE